MHIILKDLKTENVHYAYELLQKGSLTNTFH